MPAPVDISVVLKTFRRTQKRFERLATRLDDALEDARKYADAAAKEMEDLVHAFSDVSEVTPWRPALRFPKDQQMKMMREAAAGASSLQIMRDAYGRRKVSVGGRDPFALAPKLATLLAILAAPGGATHDDRPGWRTTPELATELKVPARSVPKLVYKLRRAFCDARENWQLIETSEWGYRLAVRR